MTKPLFITFEGPEGAGKTSVLEVLISELKPLLGDELITTREPGGIRYLKQFVPFYNLRKIMVWMNGQRRYFIQLRVANI